MTSSFSACPQNYDSIKFNIGSKEFEFEYREQVVIPKIENENFVITYKFTEDVEEVSATTCNEEDPNDHSFRQQTTPSSAQREPDSQTYATTAGGKQQATIAFRIGTFTLTAERFTTKIHLEELIDTTVNIDREKPTITQDITGFPEIVKGGTTYSSNIQVNDNFGAKEIRYLGNTITLPDPNPLIQLTFPDTHGEYNLEIVIEDRIGNIFTKTYTTFIDNEAPTIEGDVITKRSYSGGKNYVSFEINIKDNSFAYGKKPKVTLNIDSLISGSPLINMRCESGITQRKCSF